jgi:hypothetical protein
MHTSILCTVCSLYYYDDMGETCGGHGGERKACAMLVGKAEQKILHEDLGIDERIILEWNFWK